MFVCVAGKNNISVNALQYLMQNNNGRYELGVICNKNDLGKDGWQKSLRFFARDNEIPEFTLDEIYEKKDLIFISLEFDRIVDPSAFCDARLYNIHFSLLPQYRGMYTSALPLLNGEKTSGVTLHIIDRGIDTGDTIAQRVIEIRDTDTARDLYFKYIENGTKLFLENIEHILAGDVTCIPQKQDGATYYSKYAIDYDNLRIDLRKTAYEVKNQIRAYCFREYQMPVVMGRAIISAYITGERSNYRPETVLMENSMGMMVTTMDYNVILYYDRFNELQEACKKGDLPKVIEICTVKEHMNAKDTLGRSPLMIAADYNQIKVVEYLIMRGANR